MLVKQYVHRLPADYDMSRIRRRISERGAMWDATPGLGFKAFLVQERGRNRAVGNAYSSLYLWLREEAALDFIFDDRFRSVVDTFGRPRIDTWLAIDARRGPAERADFAHSEQLDVPVHTNLAALRESEIERNIANARRAETFATVVALDLSAWRLARFTLAAQALQASDTRHSFEVIHLAKPGLTELGR